MAAYRAEEMTLDQLMAFAITDDHGPQEAFWFEKLHGDRSPRAIRRHLTSSLVDAGDRRALFVGLKAYEEAGGTVIRDLFQPESEGYLADSQLLDRLVGEKLEEEAAPYRTLGWAWVEIMIETDYELLSRYGRLQRIEVALSEEEQKRHSELSERYDEIVVALEEQEDDEATAELDRIVEEMERLEESQLQWPEDGQRYAGIILSLDRNGELKVDEGLVRPEDRKRLAEERATASAETSEGQGEETERSNGYSDTLLTDLSAHKTGGSEGSPHPESEGRACGSRPPDGLSALLRAAGGLLREDPAGLSGPRGLLEDGRGLPSRGGASRPSQDLGGEAPRSRRSGPGFLKPTRNSSSTCSSTAARSHWTRSTDEMAVPPT